MKPDPTNEPPTQEVPDTAPGKKQRGRDFAKTFGAYLRQTRTDRRLSISTVATRTHIDPAYLSKIERGEFAPPSEEKICMLAVAMDHEPDVLLAHAGRVASDLSKIILSDPVRYAALLRGLDGCTAQDLDEVLDLVRAIQRNRSARV